MKVLLILGHDGFIRMFEPMVRSLAHRGHEVNIGLAGRRPALMSEAGSVEALVDANPGVTWDKAPKGKERELAELQVAVSAGRDYLRFLLPPFEKADALRERAREHAPVLLARMVAIPGLRARPVVLALDALLRRIEPLLPESERVAGYVEDHAPDAVLVSPLVGFGSTQPLVLRSARRLGIPSALLVHSWDNLTNKGLIHEAPDRVVVWNEAQRDEAVTLHKIPSEAVRVTGAQGFDHWFDGQPSTTREEFTRRVGLPVGRPYLLYACSSQFIAPDEVGFLREWLARVRGEERLAEAGVLIRPHPQHTAQWEGVDLGDPRVAVWPAPRGEMPAGARARAGYYDSIHHSRAVVGINTSALIEAAIQRRPVLTVLTERYRGSQEGTLHFRHLAEGDGGGLLRVARDFPEHLDHLAAALEADGADEQRARRFLERFVRPHGLEEPAAERLVACVEELADLCPAAPRTARWHALAQRALVPVARMARRWELRARGADG
jgi:hypothetical protein